MATIHDFYTHIVTYAQADYSPVVINELMALNETTIADPQGEYDDWIELANISGENVGLSVMYFSDNPDLHRVQRGAWGWKLGYTPSPTP